MDILDTTPLEEIKKDYIYHHQPPVFDAEIYNYVCDLNHHREADPNSLKEVYVKSFNDWIHNSEINNVKGLDHFEHRDFCVGVTGFLDDLYVRYGEKIRYFDHEYSYHWRLGRGKKITSYTELKAGDHLIVSCPSNYFADINPEMDQILDFCDANDVNVHIDSAWFGSVRDFNFDYNRRCIQSAGFSLSKALSSGHNRMGIRFARTREPGPITIVNDFNMGVVQLMWLGVQLMNKFPCDFLHKKYGAAYQKLCKVLELKPSKAIHIAFGIYPNSDTYEPVGISKILKKMMPDQEL